MNQNNLIFWKSVCSNTLVDGPRLKQIIQELANVQDIEGDIAEVGVYKGGTALLIAANTSKKLFLFDTFEGLPQCDKLLDLHHKGDFKDTSIRHVDELLTNYSSAYSIYKGIFPKQNSEYVAHKRFSLVHLDVDIHESVKNCLEFFHTRMVTGGVIIIDDYNFPRTPGAKKATDDFVALHDLIVTPTAQCQAIIRF